MSTVARKFCDYRDCKEYRNRDHLNPSVTFFSFPSDADRMIRWLQLSQTTAENPKFICSKHFKEIYISRNQRRVHLVNSAVPIDYKTIVPKDKLNKSRSSDEQQISTDDEAKQIFQPKVFVNNKSTLRKLLLLEKEQSTSDKEELFSDEKACISDKEQSISDKEQSFSYIDESISDKELFVSDKEQTISNKEQQPTKILNSIVSNKFLKRKIESTNVNVTKKILRTKKIEIVKVESNGVKILNNQSAPEKLQLKEDDENLSNASASEPEVKNFIVNGKEYIQMPKALYIKEKVKMLTQIKNYKNLLKDFRDKLDNCDLS